MFLLCFRFFRAMSFVRVARARARALFSSSSLSFISTRHMVFFCSYADVQCFRGCVDRRSWLTALSRSTLSSSFLSTLSTPQDSSHLSTPQDASPLSTPQDASHLSTPQDASHLSTPQDASPLSTPSRPSSLSSVKVTSYALSSTSYPLFHKCSSSLSDGSVYSFTRPECVMIQLGDDSSSSAASVSPVSVSPVSSSLPTTSLRFDPLRPSAVMYPFGGLVFFNASEQHQHRILLEISPNNSTNGRPSKSTKSYTRDEYNIVIDPENTKNQLDDDAFSSFDYDKVWLRGIDISVHRVMSHVLAQTVGMEKHEMEVEVMMRRYRDINEALAQRRPLQMADGDLFRLVAQQNQIMVEVLTSIRLFDRNEAAWRSGEAAELWDGLRNEFELQSRFSSLELKIELMQKHTTFLLEVLHNRKSSKLEWIIIVLIAVEIMISVYDHFNFGKKLTAPEKH